jgi:OOP family OmpA-OmpF porin
VRGALLFIPLLACRPAATGAREPVSVAATTGAAGPAATDIEVGPAEVTHESVDPEDVDADGVANASDRCPDEPEDADGFEDEDGCVDRDNDGDGVLDAHEFINRRWTNCDNYLINDVVVDCRNRPEDFDGFEDEDGCPDLVPRFFCPIEIATIVYFDAAGRFDRAAAGAFDEVAAMMRDAAYLELWVDAHVDSPRTDRASKKLTERVAALAVDELLRRGVARERLEPRGRGEGTPVADNKTAEGRVKNRRVEFNLKNCLEAMKRMPGYVEPPPPPPHVCR